MKFDWTRPNHFHGHWYELEYYWKFLDNNASGHYEATCDGWGKPPPRGCASEFDLNEIQKLKPNEMTNEE